MLPSRLSALPPLLALPVTMAVAPFTRAAEPAPGKIFGSAVLPWESFVAKKSSTGERRDVTNLPTATIQRFESHISTLNPGKASHPPHKHNQEEFIIVKEGTLDISINGKISRVGPGSVMFLASIDLHNLTNVGDRPATYHVFNLTTARTKDAPAEGAAQAALPGRLASNAFNWDALKVETRPNGARRGVIDSPTVTLAHMECHITTLNPGEVPHAAHRHPDEELIVVKEGTVEATIYGHAARGGPGSIFFYGSNDLHGMKNVGATPATYHVIRIVTEATPPAPAATGKKQS
jgi:uncharacterized cupin superfamily protein